MMNFCEKYHPKKLSDFLDNKQQISLLLRYVREGEKVIVHGPTGIGKTALVEVIARELDYDILALDSSSLRNKKSLEEEVIPFLSQKTLFSKGKVLLFDEMEGVSRSDRGALTFIKDISGKTKYPIVLVTTDIWNPKFMSLRYALKNIEFKAPSKQNLSEFLVKVAIDEGIDIDIENIGAIVRNNKGDVRACLNDLEAGLYETRKKDESIFEALNIVFKEKDVEKVKQSFDNVGNMRFGDYLLWVNENIPREYYSPEERDEAFQSTSKSDIFYSRIMRRNYWKLLYHAYVMATVGVMVSKKTERGEYTRFSPPSFVSKLSKTRFSRAKVRSVKSSFASKTHCSERKALEYLWMIEKIYSFDSKKGDLLANEVELDKNIVKWLKSKK